MKNIKLKWGIILLFLLNSIVSANSELAGSIEGDVSVSSGVVSYSLPINTPSASKGYSPSLSVSYKQGGGNGSLGLGFSLGGLSSISKCTTTERIDEVKGGISFSADDKYCLDGQRLIEKDSSEYRLYSSPSVKVVRNGSAANPDSWTVYNADGYISKYGADDKSKTVTSKGTVNWRISSKTDRFENATQFNYMKDENSIYIDIIEYQQYRVKFNYKNREDKIATYAFGKKSVHQKLLANIETYSNDELFSTYKMTYSKIDKSKNTTRFSKLEELTYCDGNNECLKPVKLNYEEREIYNDVEQSAELLVDELLNYVVADMNRDGFNDVCYYDGKLNCAMNRGDGSFEDAKVWTEALNTEDVYNENSPKHGFASVISEGITKDKDKSKLRSAISSTLTLLDLNRDEYIDYCVVTEKGVFCGLNNKNGSFENDKFYSKTFTVEDAYRFVDINQDKKIDLCAFTDKGLECSINSNNKFGNPIVIENVSTGLMIKQDYLIQEYDGGLWGKNNFPSCESLAIPDKFVYDESYNGTCTEKIEEVKIPQPQLIDINNDGFTDLCGIKKGTSDFYCAEGATLTSEKTPKFGTLKSWAKNLPFGNNSKTYQIASYEDANESIKDEASISRRLNRTIRFADLNSDGLADMCYRNMNNYECRINNGTGFNAATTWLRLNESDWPLTVEKNKGEADLQWIINNQEASISLADKDGDGVPDFSAVVDNALMFASNVDGKFQKLQKIIDIVPDTTEVNIRKNGVYTRPVKKWFGLKTDFHTVYGSLAYGPVKPVADLDGKENIETCYRDASGLSCVAINKQPIALLKTVTSSLGLKTTLEYGKLLSDKFYIEQDDAKSPVNDYSPNSFLVKSISTDNGVGGQNRLTYEYEGYKTHKDRGGLGFKKISITNPLKESKTVTTYIREDSALNGKVEKTEAYVRDVLVSKSTREYEVVEHSEPKAKWVRVLKQYVTAYDLNGKKLSSKVIENKKFNKYDQIEETTETINDASGEVKKVETVTEYENKPSTWILAKPKSVKVTHTTSSDSVIKESTFEYNEKGELTTEILEPNSADKLITLYSMNSGRTEGTITVKDAAGNERVSYTSYDEYGRIVSTKNVLGHEQSTTYDDLCSLPKTVTGVNGLKTEFEYDGLCRKTKEILPDGNSVETFYEWSSGTDLGIDFQNVGVLDDDTSVYMVTSRSSVGGWSRTFFDALDRKVRTVSQTTKLNADKEEETIKIFTDFVYDNKGQIVASTIPYFEGMMAGGNSQWKKVKYDILGRVIEQSQPSPRGAMVTTSTYDGLTVTTHSPKGHSTKVVKNVLDQTVSVEENDGSLVEFKYDVLGNLVETTTNAVVSSTIEYDEFSRKISMVDRTLGNWTYDYNAFGELKHQTDAEGHVSSISYDKLGRVKTKTEGGVTTTFVYDTAQNGKGKIASSSNGQVQKSYEYNSLGQVTTSTQRIDKQHFETNFEYNNAGQVSQVAYPSGMRLKYEYDINGLTKRVGIPKNDIWTQQFINLQEDLIKISKYIEELESDAKEATKKVKHYQKEFEYYSALIDKYSANEQRYANIIKTLDKSRREIQHRFNKYTKRARNLRTKANDYNNQFKKILFSYVKTVGGYNYYKYQKCVKKNKKGHCKKYKNYSVAVESEISDETLTWSLKGFSHTTYTTPMKTINLSKEYSKWAAVYEKKSRTFENKRKADLKANKSTLNTNKSSRDKYAALAKSARDDAMYYAKLAAKEVKNLEDINRKLESERNAFNETEEQIKAIQLDDSTFTLWAATNRNAQGQLEGEWYGNGYMTTKHYNTDNTIDQIKTGVGKNLIRDIRYTYDARNNILSRTDALNGIEEHYSYDDMDRINGWHYKRSENSAKKRTAKTYDRTYHYDIDGNMNFKTGVGVMTYNEKNQLKSIEGDSDFSYDKNGNMRRGNQKYYDYNAFNKVKALSYEGGFQRFDYDESNELVKKVINNNKTIYYVGTGYEVELTQLEEGTREIRRHNIMVEGNPVAVHTQTIMPDQRKADKTVYIHRDLLGSVDTVTDNQKAIVYRNEFTPYGENISNLEGNNNTDKSDLRGFTGHRQISEANIINMNARLYDPMIGRFTSADTIIPDPLKPMSYNRYMYVYGNPTGYRDPDGHFAFAIFAIGVAIFTVGATTDDPTIAKIGMTVGGVMMAGALGAHGMGLSAIESGATTGFTTAFISTGGDMGAAIQGGITSALSAGLAEGIGHGVGADGSQVFATDSLGQYLAHGTSQGFIAVLRGGKFGNGFISGIAGKMGGQVTGKLGFTGDTMGDQIGSTTIVAVFGGMSSEATGGDFYEGAMRAAFVHLYNDLAVEDWKGKKVMLKNGSTKKNILYLLKYKKDWKYSYSTTMEKTKYWRNQHKGAFFLYAHGAPNAIFAIPENGNEVYMFAEDIASLLKQEGYKTGQDIVLMSCHTGANNGSKINVAQELSNYTKSTVYAPNGFIAISGIRSNAYLTTPEYNPFAVSRFSFVRFSQK